MAKNTEWIIDLLYNSLNGVRQRRKFIEYNWLLNYRAWQGWPSQSYTLPLPDGAIHYFIPHARRAIERNVSRVTKLLMPRTEWFQVLPNDMSSYASAEAVQSVYNYFYTKKLKTKRLISSWARCLYLYDFAVCSTALKIEGSDENPSVWPLHRDVDPFNFYIFPDTAATVEDALLIFEDRIIPWQVYNSLVDQENPKTSYYEYINPNELTNPEWPYHLIERLAYRGISNPSDFTQGTGNYPRYTEAQVNEFKTATSNKLSAQNKVFVSLTKVYFRLSQAWYVAEICNNTPQPRVVRLDDVECLPLYRWCAVRALPGELYLNSPMEDIRTLQDLTNTTLSQLEANRQVITEPPIAIDSAAVGRLEPYTFQNRKWWKLNGNPNELIKQLDLRDTLDDSLKAFQVYLAQINSLAGAGTIAEGQPGRNMPRAGFAVDSLINLALTDLEDVANSMEQELLTTMLSDAYHIFNEYIPPSQVMKIPGKAKEMPQAYTTEDLYGDYTFSWVGASGFQDVQQTADKFMRFLELMINPQIQQMLQQQGQRVDLSNLIKMIYTTGIGERGLSNIIIPIPEQELEQIAQQSAQQQQLQQGLIQADVQNKASDSQAKMISAQASLLKAKGDIKAQEDGLDFQEIQQLLASIGSSSQNNTQTEGNDNG